MMTAQPAADPADPPSPGIVAKPAVKRAVKAAAKVAASPTPGIVAKPAVKRAVKAAAKAAASPTPDVAAKAAAPATPGDATKPAVKRAAKAAASPTPDVAARAAAPATPGVAPKRAAKPAPRPADPAPPSVAARPAEPPAEARVDPSASGFADLGLDPRLLVVLQDLGYEEPTPIQREAIPVLVAGRDLVGQAATGTGKTAAFALPILGALRADRGGPGPHALVLVPTRELAVQVAEAVHRYGRGLGVSVLPVYGGQAISQQLRALHRGVDIVVATPGRAVDHLGRGSMDLSGVRTVVLDEADEMLDMGFAEDLEAILSATPSERQTVLFSATLAPRVVALAKKHLRTPATIEIKRESAPAGEEPRVPQVGYLVQRAHKLTALGRILDMEPPDSAIIFCRTRTEVDVLTEALNARGYRAEALHGGLSQEQRDRVMRRFRDETTDLLVATDVAARGLDIDHVSHVINYDVPASPEVYVHRTGRTGRAGRAGMAITLAEPRERRLLRNIEQFTGQRIEPATIPTVSDLRARQMQQTRAAVEEALQEGDFDKFRVIVEALGDNHDVMDVAAAAMKLAHAALAGTGADEDIPAVVMREPFAPPARTGAGSFARDAGAGRPSPDGGRSTRDSKGGGMGAGTGARGRSRSRGSTAWEVARVFIGAGRSAGVRPADIVGAIANEAGISPRLIGAIEIGDRFTIAEVPDEIAATVVAALSAATIRGRRVEVRREGER